MIDLSPTPYLWILIVLGVLLLVQWVYYLFYFLKLTLHKQKENTNYQPPVSVVICAKNELENLQQFLPLVLQQKYPNYEVVVVNDCSWDNSYDFLKELAIQYPHLRVADIKEVYGREHGKKFALTIGIKAAKHEIVLLTDADCYPSSENWISEMINTYDDETQVVLGYGKYERNNGILNLLIRWETFFNSVLYFSRTLLGKPYMAVGRNLSYKKQNFFAQKGFASHMHIESGDDDLFIQSIAKEDNTKICINKDSHTVSLAKKTWMSWFRQKKRHQSTAKYYKSGDRLYLWLYPLSLLLFYVIALVGLVLQYNMLIIIVALFLRAILQICILHSLAKKLNEKQVSWLAPFLEIIMYLIIYPVYKVSTVRLRKNKWK